MGAAGARGEEGLGDERSPSIDNTRTNVAGLVEQRTDGADNGSRKPNGRFEIAMNKHNFRSFILGFSLVSCLSASPAVAATVDTTGLTTCSLSGWSSDPDPAGLNIRSAPRADAEIIGRVSAARAQGRDSYAAEFDIIGSRNGWFLVRGVKFADYGSGKGDSVVFAGPGWVFADKVRFMINRAEVRGAPADNGPVLARLRSADGASGPDSAFIDHVFGCSGAFAEAAVHMEGQRAVRGWVTGICSNQVTTCP